MNVPTHEPTYQGELVLTHAGASLHEDYGPAFVGFVAEVYRAELLPHPEGGLRLKWQRHAYHAGIDIDDMWELPERNGYIPFHKLSRRPGHEDKDWEFAGCGEFLHTATSTAGQSPEERAVYQALRVGCAKIIGVEACTPEALARTQQQADQICSDLGKQGVLPHFDCSVKVDPEDPTAVTIRIIPRGLL